MTNLNLEVPAEVREFAEKTVDQARKAFDSFVAAAQKASAQSEAATESLTSNVKEVSSKAIGFAETNVKAAFDLVEKLVQAKDPREILSIQSDFLKAQVATVQEQAKALGEAADGADGQRTTRTPSRMGVSRGRRLSRGSGGPNTSAACTAWSHSRRRNRKPARPHNLPTYFDQVVSRPSVSRKTTCFPSVRTHTYQFRPRIMIFVSSTSMKGLCRMFLRSSVSVYGSSPLN